MNTPWSMAVGWGSLLLAGGSAYYFAKKDINNRRDLEHKKRLANTGGVTYTASVQKDAHPSDPGGVIRGPEDRYRLVTRGSTGTRDK
ncbi:hypothetical protein PYCC9005_001577 [Savitreella phatthalungensis]